MIQPPSVILSLVNTQACTLTLSYTHKHTHTHTSVAVDTHTPAESREKQGSKQLPSSHNNGRRTVVQ